MERLGLAPLLEARGAVRAGVAFWSPHSEWIRLPDDMPRAWGVTRRTLDPLVRELAAGTPGVELLLGQTVVDLVRDHGRPAGVRLNGTDGRGRVVRARLVVGADGRGSTVARLARVPGRVRPHGRFFYFAYWRGVQPASTDMRGWLMDPDGAAQFPNEDDQTVLVASVTRPRLPEFRADLEGAYARWIARAARRPGPQPGGAHVEADRQARHAERHAPGGPARHRVRRRRRAGYRSALGRGLRLGVPERGVAGGRNCGAL